MGRALYDPRYDDQRPWNAGKLVGAKKPFKQKQIWAMRFFLDYEHRVRDRRCSIWPSTASCAAAM